MGMSMHVVAVKPADEDYQRKAAAYRACKAAGIRPPNELIDFFGGTAPDDTGTTVSLGMGPYYNLSSPHESTEPWSDNDGEAIGFQVDITKLPAGTRYVRFWCSR